MNTYPKTYRSFLQWCNSNKLYGHFFMKNLFNIQLYDVTLRTIPNKQFVFYDKVQSFHEIYFNHYPQSFEIGPIKFKNNDSISYNEINLYDYILNHQNLLKYPNKKNYISVSNIETLIQILQEEQENIMRNFNCLSFLPTSTKIQEENMNKILYFLSYLQNQYKCKNNTPIFKTKTNVILTEDHDFIIHKMLKYHQNNINTICLSDPNSIINEEDFQYILTTTNYYGLPFSQIALELYLNKNEVNNEKLIKKLIHNALDYGIREFNVSLIDEKNESKNKKKLNIITYELFYKFLVDYIIKKTEK